MTMQRRHFDLKGSAPYLTLRGSRGRILATLYAIPYHFNAEG